MVCMGPRVCRKQERVTDLPSNASRLIRRPLGVHGTWVNGVRVAGADGNVLAAVATSDGLRPGVLMREFGPPGR